MPTENILKQIQTYEGVVGGVVRLNDLLTAPSYRAFTEYTRGDLRRKLITRRMALFTHPLPV